MQYTGSFKVRGALNKIKNMPSEARKIGVVAASTGNHGMATCYAANKVGNTPVTIYVPKGASQVKQDAIRSMGGEIVVVDSPNCLDAELAARKAAEEQDKTFLSPYNDMEVMFGQATIGLEIEEQMQRQGLKPDVIFVSVGGGGMIGGIGAYINEVFPDCEIVGCQPENSKVMAESIAAGRILDDVKESPTLSDATAGGIEEDALTFTLVQEVVDRFVNLTEKEIARAMLWALEKEHMMIEGAAALVIGALLRDLERYRDKNVVLVLCGRNVSYSVIQGLEAMLSE